MNRAIENLRILTETTFDDFPLVSISAWTTQAIKDYEELEAALKELVELKDIKDSDGKTNDYLERQPKAWVNARKLLEDK